MTNGEICDGSSSAAVNLPSGLRVYFQDRDGYVREARQENGIWRGGTCQNILFRAKPGSPLAATAWGDNHVHNLLCIVRTRMLTPFRFASIISTPAAVSKSSVPIAVSQEIGARVTSELSVDASQHLTRVLPLSAGMIMAFIFVSTTSVQTALSTSGAMILGGGTSGRH